MDVIIFYYLISIYVSIIKTCWPTNFNRCRLVDWSMLPPKRRRISHVNDIDIVRWCVSIFLFFVHRLYPPDSFLFLLRLDTIENRKEKELQYWLHILSISHSIHCLNIDFYFPCNTRELDVEKSSQCYSVRKLTSMDMPFHFVIDRGTKYSTVRVPYDQNEHGRSRKWTIFDCLSSDN